MKLSSSGLLITSQMLLLNGSSEGWMPQHRRNHALSFTHKPTTHLQSASERHDSSSNNGDSSSRDPLATMRLRLEMHWELEETKSECVVEDPSTCGGEVCSGCQGHGQTTCRFCRGTGQMYMGQNDGFKSCPICSAKGEETCSSCKGTGWVAHWTTLGGGAGTAPLGP